MTGTIVPITDLPQATLPLTGVEVIPVVQGGITRQVAVAAIANQITLPLVVGQGGTGLSATVQGDLLYADVANSLARLAKDTNATRYLSNAGASNNPAWAQVSLANGVTGTLPLVNGGTGEVTAVAAANALLPAQATHAGEFLQTDGAGNLSWAAAGGGGVVTGTFTAQVTGFTVPDIDFDVNYQIVGNVCTLWAVAGEDATGENDAGVLQLLNLPVAVRPAAQKDVPCHVVNDGGHALGAATVDPTGFIDFEAFDAAGGLVVQIPNGFVPGEDSGLTEVWTITYPLT